jgi:hypothetical protein
VPSVSQLLGAPPRVELTLDTESGAPSLAIQRTHEGQASAPPTGEERAVLAKGESVPTRSRCAPSSRAGIS